MVPFSDPRWYSSPRTHQVRGFILLVEDRVWEETRSSRIVLPLGTWHTALPGLFSLEHRTTTTWKLHRYSWYLWGTCIAFSFLASDYRRPVDRSLCARDTSGQLISRALPPHLSIYLSLSFSLSVGHLKTSLPYLSCELFYFSLCWNFQLYAPATTVDIFHPYPVGFNFFFFFFISIFIFLSFLSLTTSCVFTKRVTVDAFFFFLFRFINNFNNCTCGELSGLTFPILANGNR